MTFEEEVRNGLKNKTMQMFDFCLECEHLQIKESISPDRKTMFYCNKDGVYSLTRAWITRGNELVVFNNDNCPKGHFVALGADQSNFTFNLGGNYD